MPPLSSKIRPVVGHPRGPSRHWLYCVVPASSWSSAPTPVRPVPPHHRQPLPPCVVDPTLVVPPPTASARAPATPQYSVARRRHGLASYDNDGSSHPRRRHCCSRRGAHPSRLPGGHGHRYRLPHGRSRCCCRHEHAHHCAPGILYPTCLPTHSL